MGGDRMTNPDRMRLEEISFPECLSAVVFNLYIQIMFTGTRGAEAELLQPRSRCSGWAALGGPLRGFYVRHVSSPLAALRSTLAEAEGKSTEKKRLVGDKKRK